MLTVSPEVLSLSSEAVLLARGGRIVYANPRAEAAIGGAAVGKSTAELFGEGVANAQAGSFAADVPVGGDYCGIRTLRLADAQVFYLQSPGLSSEFVSDALICSVRSLLMNMRVSIELLRSCAEGGGDEELSRSALSLLRGYFGLVRILDNASVLRDSLCGRLEPKLSPLCLSSLCRDVCGTLSLLRRDLSFVFSSDGDIWINGDRALVEQLVLNLVSNALMHAEGLSRVSLRVSRAGTLALLSVTDDGCGMDDAALSRAFERCGAPYELSQLGGGAGLGLSAVRAISRLHGGALMLESRPGAGTSARVSFARLNASGGSLSQEQGFPDAMQRLLTALSGCLPPECFRGVYLD